MGWRSKSQQPPQMPREWPEPSLEPRVLVEDADESGRWATARLLARTGFEVAECPGPNATRGWECPIVGGANCELVEGADAIVFSLSLRGKESRKILVSHRQDREQRPLCVEATAPEAETYSDLLDGCRVVDPAGLGDLITEIVSALRTRPDDGLDHGG